MKFTEMPYSRPDGEALKGEMALLTKRLENAADYKEAKAVFEENEKLTRHYMTLATLAEIRQSIDTNDAFYDGEKKFWNALSPELEEYSQAWTQAMLKSPFREDFAAEFGDLMFKNAEMDLKTFSPEIIELLKEENDAATEYEKLLASAMVSFKGKEYTLPQLEPFETDNDDELRLEAWKAEGSWFKENQPKLDELYERLVRLRDEMGRRLGYKGYTELGYYRMRRNCYTAADVEKFRKAVVKYVVPIAERLFREQAKRINKPYPLSFADKALEFRGGNPKPCTDSEGIVRQAKKLYDELSPETSEFFGVMLEGGLLDLLSKEGKASGGYCTSLFDYRVPFIFANFNGTQGDVEVVTHEAGHAFADYMNRNRVPMEYTEPTYEACEVHSMSMEFIAWRWAEGFFGGDTEKFKYSHLASALKFIPYGTAVDHFQHIAYEKPDLTPAERHAEWKKLLGIYMPWIRIDGEIPFYGEGMDWQMKHHIYSLPFYYIDYCFAQTVALQFWALSEKDGALAWEKYMAYTRLGGSRTFTELLREAGLESPFDESCLKNVCEAAQKRLDEFDMSGIE